MELCSHGTINLVKELSLLNNIIANLVPCMKCTVEK